jgi:hypothetical protein
MTESPEWAATKPLLDAAKDRGFTFERITVGQDAPLRGVRESRPARWALSPLDCQAHLLVRDHPPGVLKPRCGEVLPTVAVPAQRPIIRVAGRVRCVRTPPESWRPDSRLAAGGTAPDSPRSRRPAGPFLRPTNPPGGLRPPAQPAGRDTIPAPRGRNDVNHD